MTLNSVPVALFFTVTLAPATAEPFGSSTAPESGAVVAVCPKAAKLDNARKLVIARSLVKLRFIQNLLRGWFWGYLFK
jgi:hypothetical protein